MWQRGGRQAAALEAISGSCRALTGASALIVLGSCARDDVDEMSDLDLMLVVAPDLFESVWGRRNGISRNALWSADSPQSKALGPGAHKWLTRDLVFVEMLIGEPTQLRLAEPFRVLWGDPSSRRSRGAVPSTGRRNFTPIRLQWHARTTSSRKLSGEIAADRSGFLWQLLVTHEARREALRDERERGRERAAH